MNPTYKKINYTTYTVKKFDPAVNKNIYYIYLTKETKDQLKEQLNREINRWVLGWEEKKWLK